MNTGVSPTALIVVGIIGAAAALFGAFINNRTLLAVERVKAEQAREAWVRDRRLESAQDFLTAAMRMYFNSKALNRDTFLAASEELERAAVTLCMTAPRHADEVRSIRSNFSDAAFQLMNNRVKSEEWETAAKVSAQTYKELRRELPRIANDGEPRKRERLDLSPKPGQV